MKKVVLIASLIFSLTACNSSKVTEVSKEEVPVTYSNTIKRIVANKCVGCHKVYGSGGLNLESYENVKNSAQNGHLLERINDEQRPMPKAGLMSQKNRDAFQKWKENGFAE